MSLQRAETPKRFHYLVGWMLVLAGVPLLSLLAQFSARTAVAQTLEPPPPPKPPFLIRSYESTQPFASTRSRTIKGKCLDYGIPPAAPNTIGIAGAIGVAGTAVAQTPNSVFVNDCDVAHPIVVEEINDKHEVILHAGSQVIGIRRTLISTQGFAASGAASSPGEYPLQLINQRLPAAAALVNDVFALDGDSIILATSRCADPASCGPQLVVQLQSARSDNGTPLVLGPRNLAETEFWDFLATDGSNADPTTGFVQVSTRDDLLIAMYRVNQIAQLNNGAAWGSVIKIVGAVALEDAIDLTANPAYIDPQDGTYHNLVIPAGVTIRGDRRGQNLGPLLIGNYADTTKGLLQSYYHTTFDITADHMLEIEGNNVRITGLRIQGPSGSTDLVPEADGIHIGNPYIDSEFSGVLIDHNDISDWPLAGVGPFGGHEDRDCSDTSYIGPIDSLRVWRNFIHHNAMQGLGYGTVVGDGAGAAILGNTFLMNRHAIASDGDTGDQYSAWDNLVLSRAATFGFNNHAEQDFDMHGTLSQDGQQHDGGYAGNYVEIAWNTFPCDALDGVKDGVIEDPRRCHFDPATILCKQADQPSCLTAPQVEAARKIYSGPKNPRTKQQIAPGFSPGVEAAAGTWAPWIAGTEPGKPALLDLFVSAFFGDMVFGDPNWDFHKFDFDRDVTTTSAKFDRFLSATNPDLDSFRTHGGKLIQYHGWGDPAIAPLLSIQFYESVVVARQRASHQHPLEALKETQKFYRLFMVPGMGHCGGGSGPNNFGNSLSASTDPARNIVSALNRWVEDGVAPEQLIATKYQGDDAGKSVIRTRPLCPYPQMAEWKGSGSTDDSANFVCRSGSAHTTKIKSRK